MRINRWDLETDNSSMNVFCNRSFISGYFDLIFSEVIEECIKNALVPSVLKFDENKQVGSGN